MGLATKKGFLTCIKQVRKPSFLDARCLSRRGRRIDADSAPLGWALKLHLAINEAIDGVVPADPNVAAGMKLRAALANNDIAGDDNLTTILLDSKHLGL